MGGGGSPDFPAEYFLVCLRGLPQGTCSRRERKKRLLFSGDGLWGCLLSLLQGNPLSISSGATSSEKEPSGNDLLLIGRMCY